MKLSQLIQNLPFSEKRNYADTEITGIGSNSLHLKPGEIFVALTGFKTDGHQYIPQAVAQGAAALIVEKNVPVPEGIPVFRVQNTRLALSRLASLWQGQPSRNFPVIGVTGTNGKTTIACLVETMLQQAGHRVGRIGTIGWNYPGHSHATDHTTPESTELQAMLAAMRDAAVDRVVMEVSSHAIDLNRVADIAFNTAVFTNLTPEHLDYHKSMELYFESKKRLFTHLLPRGQSPMCSVINADDVYGQRLIEILQGSPLLSYSIHPQSKWSLFVKQWVSSLEGLKATVATPEGDFEFTSPLIGGYNLSNLLAATGACLSLGTPLAAIGQAIEGFSQVPGRLERVANAEGLHIFVDYAHTPDALKNVLQAIRHLNPARILTVFGCGGDRDRGKRPIMGREVARFSDLAVVTSDNPRTEDPQRIVDEILPGIQEGGMTLGKDCFVEIDRHQAIRKALELARSGDVLLIAGKGHEDYQIIGREKIHFDDREEVCKALGCAS